MRKRNKKAETSKNTLLNVAFMIIVTAIVFALIAHASEQIYPQRQANINISAFTNRTNALYGVPDPNSYEFFLNIGPYSNRSQGLEYYFAGEYGLNFTSPVMAGSNELPFDYPLVPPPSLRNSTAPVAMLISVFHYVNESATLQYQPLSNGTKYFFNNNYFASAHNYDFSANASSVSVSMPNARAFLVTLSPAYTSLELNQFDVIYKNYVVIVAVFGLKNTYSQNYTLNIGRHIYAQLQGV